MNKNVNVNRSFFIQNFTASSWQITSWKSTFGISVITFNTLNFGPEEDFCQVKHDSVPSTNKIVLERTDIKSKE